MKKHPISTAVTARINTFKESLKDSSFRKLTLVEKKKMFQRLGIKFPKRTTSTHHLQDMYIFELDGYRVVINSGIIGNTLLTPGLSWVMITCDDKRLFVRAFKSDFDEPTQQMLDRLLAYALVMQWMLILRPLDNTTGKLKSLVEKEEEFINKKGKFKKRIRAYWVCDNDKDDYVFSPTNCYPLLKFKDEHLTKAFLKKEAQLEYYYEHRTAMRFRKDVRKKSKVTKPGNRIGTS